MTDTLIGIFILLIFPYIGDSPEVTFHGRTDLHFPYISSHLSYIMLGKGKVK